MYVSELSKTCQKCKLHQGAQTYRITPIIHRKSSELHTVLVLASQPTKGCDYQGVSLSSKESGIKAFKDWMNLQPYNWVGSYVVRCYPGVTPKGKPKAANISNVNLCRTETVLPLIETSSPNVIIALGKNAMRSLLGDQAPPSVKQGVNYIFRTEFNGKIIPVILLPDLSEEQLTKEDLSILENLLKEAMQDNKVEDPYPYELIDSTYRMEQLSNTLSETIVVDWEYAASDLIKDMVTLHHPKAEAICVSITEIIDDSKIGNTYVIPKNLCYATKMWEKILSGRRMIAHNVKTELNCFRRFSKVDFYSLFDTKSESDYRVIDTMVNAYCEDHGVYGIGLKDQITKLKSCADWSVEARLEIDRCNKSIALEHHAIDVKIKKCRKDNNETDALRWEKYKSENLRPLNSAHYGDISDEVVWKYNAADTINTAWLYLYQKENYTTDRPILKELYQRILFLTFTLEGNGLPIDFDLTAEYMKRVKRKEKSLVGELLRYEVIREIMLEYEDQDKLGCKTIEEFVDKTLKVGESAFLMAVAVNTDNVVPLKSSVKDGVTSFSPILDKEVLLNFAGGEDDTSQSMRKEGWCNWENKNENQKIWSYILALKQNRSLQSKSFPILENYIVDNHIHTDFRVARVEFNTPGENESGGGAGSGRLSTSNPSVQNLKTDSYFRSMFRCKQEEYMIAEFDYDRIEPVLLAYLADVQEWKRIFKNNWDLYAVIANYVYGLGVDMSLPDYTLTKELKLKIPSSHPLRKEAKTRTLAKIYGETIAAFARKSGTTYEEASHFYTMFDSAFPEIKKFFSKIEYQILRREQVISKFERPKTFSKSDMLSGKNFGIQGFASDVTLWLGANCLRNLKRTSYNEKVKPFHVIHDAMFFKIHRDVLPEAVLLIQNSLQDSTQLPMKDFDVPLRVGCKIGRHWGSFEPNSKVLSGGMREISLNSVDEINKAIEDVYAGR